MFKRWSQLMMALLWTVRVYGEQMNIYSSGVRLYRCGKLFVDISIVFRYLFIRLLFFVTYLSIYCFVSLLVYLFIFFFLFVCFLISLFICVFMLPCSLTDLRHFLICLFIYLLCHSVFLWFLYLVTYRFFAEQLLFINLSIYFFIYLFIYVITCLHLHIHSQIFICV